MNKAIKALNKKLSAIAGNAAEIENKLQEAWNKVFDKNKDIKKAVQQVESSQEYAWDQHGEIVTWIRFDTSDFKECREYLKTYMRDAHFVEVDFQNDVLMYSQGFNIVINGDGDVYDQDGDKFFIKKNDYRDENGELDIDKRNQLIEEYMEKTGCFPGVFSSDRYGNVVAVNTQKKARSA